MYRFIPAKFPVPTHDGHPSIFTVCRMDMRADNLQVVEYFECACGVYSAYVFEYGLAEAITNTRAYNIYAYKAPFSG